MAKRHSSDIDNTAASADLAPAVALLWDVEVKYLPKLRVEATDEQSALAAYLTACGATSTDHQPTIKQVSTC